MAELDVVGLQALIGFGFGMHFSVEAVRLRDAGGSGSLPRLGILRIGFGLGVFALATAGSVEWHRTWRGDESASRSLVTLGPFLWLRMVGDGSGFGRSGFGFGSAEPGMDGGLAVASKPQASLNAFETAPATEASPSSLSLSKSSKMSAGGMVDWKTALLRRRLFWRRNCAQRAVRP